MAITFNWRTRWACLRILAKTGLSKILPNRSGNTHRVSKIWLDLLPLEICEMIAANVSGGRITTDSVYLAQTSSKQRKAIVTSLSHTLMLDTELEHKLEWILIFKQDIEKVSITHGFMFFPPWLRAEEFMLLSAPSLRYAEITDNRAVPRGIAGAKSLEGLTLSLFEIGHWEIDNALRLMQALGRLRLRKLELRCATPSRSTCPLTLIEQLGDSRFALARCCPNLSSFHISGCSHGPTHQSKMFWTIWSSLPHIREVVVSAAPPDEVIPRLRTIQSVKILHMDDAVSLAQRLGTFVTHLCSTSQIMRAEDIANLSECKNMSEMSVLLDAGAEGSLQEVVRAMPGLGSLTIRGRCRETVVIADLDGSDGQTEILVVPQYFASTPGTMFRVVQQGPALVHLNIFAVRIRLREIVNILRYLGGRLTHFGVSFTGIQHEPSLCRFSVIMETIITHNGGLRTVSAGGQMFPRHFHIDVIEQSFRLTEAQAIQIRHGKIMLHALLRRVKTHVPMLDMESVKTWINAVLWIDDSVQYSSGNWIRWMLDTR